MKLQDIISELSLRVVTGTPAPNVAVNGGYVGDLLSDVLGKAKPGDLWVTMQIHRNIVAVATVKELSGIVLIAGREPGDDTVRAATEEGICLMTSPLPAFELVGRLHRMGIGGTGQ